MGEVGQITALDMDHCMDQNPKMDNPLRQNPLRLLPKGARLHLAQDKGGPSKGGFLNNRLFSYTDLYLCNEINGMCILAITYSGKSSNIQETTFTRTTFVLARMPLMVRCLIHLSSRRRAADNTDTNNTHTFARTTFVLARHLRIRRFGGQVRLDSRQWIVYSI